ncbi:MAG: hypothetical protein KDI17_07155 [Halioglobus sp.]|nr:hypothetical protein [Halioglobus sp.]
MQKKFQQGSEGMNGFTKKTLLILYLAALITGCKVTVIVPSGGTVQSHSGVRNCTESSVCEFEVTSLPFSDSFTALPSPGYEFEKWSDGGDFQCANSTKPACLIDLADNPYASAILALFDSMYVMPIFRDVGIDTDDDGVRNELDEDDDNDGILDADDVCPINSDQNCSTGAPDSPNPMSFSTTNQVSANSFFNYYHYTAQKNERIIIHTALSTPLSTTQKSRCASSPGTGQTPSNYDTQIHVYNENMARVDGICGENLTFITPETGQYLFQFEYPTNSPGVFYIASVMGSSAVNTPTGTAGSPNNPKTLLPGTQNPISKNTFYNYYKLTVSAGARLIINVQLDEPLSTIQKSRCSSNLGTGPIPSSYDTQIHVYNENMVRVDGICGENLDFIVPAAGTYILHFSYATQSAGYVNAAVID